VAGGYPAHICARCGAFAQAHLATTRVRFCAAYRKQRLSHQRRFCSCTRTAVPAQRSAHRRHQLHNSAPRKRLMAWMGRRMTAARAYGMYQAASISDLSGQQRASQQHRLYLDNAYQ